MSTPRAAAVPLLDQLLLLLSGVMPTHHRPDLQHLDVVLLLPLDDMTTVPSSCRISVSSYGLSVPGRRLRYKTGCYVSN